MSQAKRHRRSKPRSRRRRGGGSSPWVMLGIGLICGAILGALYMGSREEQTGRFGKGIRTLLDRSQETAEITKPATSQDQTVEREATPKPKLDYYTVLPEIERVIPEEDFVAAEPAPEAPRKPALYVLQAASYAQEQEAERLKAKLALSGFEPIIQRVHIESKGTYYRVRLGPYQNTRNLKRDKNRLVKMGINALALRLDEN